MEAVINSQNISTAEPPAESADESIIEHSLGEANKTPITAVIETTEKPREHVRTPALKRHSARLLMTTAAAIGAAAGARLAFGLPVSAAFNEVSQSLSGDFSTVFFGQVILSVIFLGAEFILGFFAFGDVLVWTAPFLCAAGTVLRIAAATPKLLPGALLCLGAVVFGAAYSADMSGLLFRLSRGGTVHMEACPRRSYAFSFLGCLTAAVLGALLAAFLV